MTYNIRISGAHWLDFVGAALAKLIRDKTSRVKFSSLFSWKKKQHRRGRVYLAYSSIIFVKQKQELQVASLFTSILKWSIYLYFSTIDKTQESNIRVKILLIRFFSSGEEATYDFLSHPFLNPKEAMNLSKLLPTTVCASPYTPWVLQNLYS